MILKNTDLWTSDADLILVTTNSTINSRGELVMGRGAALQAKQRFPRLAKAFANAMRDVLPKYGVVILSRDHPSIQGFGRELGAFQVKYGYYENASLELIANSCKVLKDLVPLHIVRVAMNFPGIGWGGLDRKLVLPIIEQLSDSVEVHELL